MPKLSQEKKDKISEQILNYLFTISPEPKFTVDVADNIIRDEEFTKLLLLELEKKKLIVQINKNKNGVDYLKRQRWRLSNRAFEVYKKHQSGQNVTFSSQLQQSL
jgi:hypothetical protein